MLQPNCVVQQMQHAIYGYRDCARAHAQTRASGQGSHTYDYGDHGGLIVIAPNAQVRRSTVGFSRRQGRAVPPTCNGL